MKSILRNREGIESLPLKLLITALIIMIVTPVLWTGITGYSRMQVENNVKAEIHRIIDTAKQAYGSSPGTSFKIDIGFANGITTSVDHIKIGDKIGEHGLYTSTTARYKIAGEAEKTVVIEPNIPVTSVRNEPLTLLPGKHTLIVEHSKIAWKSFVVVKTLAEKGLELKMADVTVYKDEIQITNRDPLPNGNPQEGKKITATIRNIGNLDTDDPDAQWPQGVGGPLKVRFYDVKPLKGEIDQLYEEEIDNIPAGSSITVSYEPWVLVGPGDDPQDPDLRVRKILVVVDAEDHVDEVTAENNHASATYIVNVPIVKSVTAEIDDDAPGIGTFVAGVYCKNTIKVEVSDPDGNDEVTKVAFWYGDKKYPDDKDNPSYVDTDPSDGFSVDINMGDIEHTSFVTAKAFDTTGLAGDPFYEIIYMEIIPGWMQVAGTKGARGIKESGLKSFTYDVSTNVFKLTIDVPRDLIQGFQEAFGSELPFISGKTNAMGSSYTIELEVPIGADVTFSKEIDLGAMLLGGALEGTGKVTAKLHVGLDKTIEINLTKIFDLVEDARYLVYHIQELEDILQNIDWSKIKNPANVNELISTLSDAYNQLEPEFNDVKNTIGRIKNTIQEYKDCYDELKDLWEAIMNYRESPESLLSLVSFEAIAEAKIWKHFSYTIFEAAYCIFPPFVTCTVKVSACFTPTFETSAMLKADLNGLDFVDVGIGAKVDFKLTVYASVNVGIDVWIAGGGLRGWISGEPTLTLNAGANYSTPGGSGTWNGFRPYFNGLFVVVLNAGLEAYVKFLGWEKTWTFWEGSYTLGEWSFDLVDGGSQQISGANTPEDAEEQPGNISLPRGPVYDIDSLGNKMTIQSYDYYQNPNNPNYEIRWRLNDGPWTKLTTGNTKIEAEPAIVYNSTDYAFAFWTQCCDNIDLASTTLTINDILKDTDIYYSIYDKNTGEWSSPAPLSSDPLPDFSPSAVAEIDGNVTITWKRDTDGDITTTPDQVDYERVWNGTAWSEPQSKRGGRATTAFDYYNQMVSISDGRLVSVWIRDIDGDLYTTADQQLMYSVRSDGVWSTPVPLTDDNSSKEFISLAGNGDKVLLSWLSKANYVWTIYTKVWDRETSSWSSTETFNTSQRIIQYPLVAVRSDGIAILTWRSNYDIVNWSNPEEGYIYYSTKDLEINSPWTSPRVLAVTNTAMRFYSTMTLDPDDKLIYTYRNVSGPLDNLTEELHTVILELKPDLFVSSVTIDGGTNVTAVEGDTVQVTATISNLGNIDAQNLNISFYNGNPNTGGELFESRVINNLPLLGSQAISIDWRVNRGVQEIYVLVDPNDEISERDEDNNIGYCTVNCLPDLVIESNDINITPSSPSAGDTIQIKAKVHNNGVTTAENVSVKFYNGNPAEGGVQIGTTKNIESITVGGTVETSITWVVPGGTIDIFVEIVEDPIGELSIENNLASIELSILPDLVLEPGDLSISSSEVVEGEVVEISALIRNNGKATAENVIVKFYTSDLYIGYKVVTVPHGASNYTSIEWQPPRGVHLVYVKLDPGNQIAELDETNNIQYVTLTALSSVDLSVQLNLIEKEPGKIEITALVTNYGSGNVSTVEIAFYDGNPETNGSLISSTIVDYIEASSSETVSFDWATSAGNKTVYAVVDESDLINESDETNNIAYGTITVSKAAVVEEEAEGVDIVGYIKQNPFTVILIAVAIAIIAGLIYLLGRRRGGDRRFISKKPKIIKPTVSKARKKPRIVNN